MSKILANDPDRLSRADRAVEAVERAASEFAAEELLIRLTAAGFDSAVHALAWATWDAGGSQDVSAYFLPKGKNITARTAHDYGTEVNIDCCALIAQPDVLDHLVHGDITPIRAGHPFIGVPWQLAELVPEYAPTYAAQNLVRRVEQQVADSEQLEVDRAAGLYFGPR